MVKDTLIVVKRIVLNEDIVIKSKKIRNILSYAPDFPVINQLKLTL